MRYFDSPKNRAKWEKEMEGLEAERVRRKEEGYKPAPKEEKMAEAREASEARPKLKDGVRRINMAQLEQIVRERKGIAQKEETTVKKRRVKELTLGTEKVVS